MRSGLLALVGCLVVALASGCSGEEDLAPPPELPTTSVPLWNPCDGLSHDEVGRRFGTTFEVSTGTPEEPRCSFVPPDEGDPALDVNYQQFAGSMDELFGTFGEITQGADTQVTSPTVDAADAARLVVAVEDDTLAVTGFVQNGQLVQVVNAIDPAPFDRALITTGVQEILADLAAHAVDAGVS